MNLFVFSFWLGLYIAFYFYASTSPLEHYKDIAQAPGTGVHETRILKNSSLLIFDYPVTGNGFALVDTFATLLLSLIIAVWFRLDWPSVFIVLIFISVPIHMLFGVETNLLKLINGVTQFR
jgi:hypothetical protein